MRLPGLAWAVLTAAVLHGPVRADDGTNKSGELRKDEPSSEKSVDKTVEKTLYKKLAPLDVDAARLQKLFLVCKKTGDCEAYRLAKENLKKEDKEEASQLEPTQAPAPAPPKPAAGVPVEPASVARGGVAAAAGPPPTAEQAAAMSGGAGVRRERTMSRASGAADSMRRAFFPAEALGVRPAGPSEPRPAAAPEPARAAGGGETRSVPELALAERTGYAAAFRDQGLKVGPGPRGEPSIQRADGTPASAEDLSRLRAALSAEPAALARRPDFYEVLPRQRYADLKRDFTGRPDLRPTAFKDMGLEQNRDFRWTVSCSVLSGGCNPLARGPSYRKGQDVPPEDLKEVWKAVHAEEAAEEEEEDGFGEYTEEDRRLAAAEDLAAEKLAAGGGRKAPSLASLLARMGELARGGAEAAGLLSVREAAPAPAEAGGVAVPSPGGVAVGAPAAAGPAASRAAFARSPEPPPAPGGRRAADVRGYAYAAGALLAAGLILKGLRRTP